MTRWHAERAADAASPRPLLSGIPPGLGARLRIRHELPFEFLGGSMLPLLWPGDRVRIRGLEPADIRLGEIVALELRGVVVLHRIVALTTAGEYVVTRGDACREPDPPTPTASLVGTFGGLADARRDRTREPYLPWQRLWWDRLIKGLLASGERGSRAAAAMSRLLYAVRLARWAAWRRWRRVASGQRSGEVP